MVRRNWINGKKRKRNKTYAERFIDRAMNDGEARTSKQIIEKILEYIDSTERTLTYTFVPTKGKVSSYISSNKQYEQVEKPTNRHSGTYVKIYICESCDGTGFINHDNCKDCTEIRIKCIKPLKHRPSMKGVLHCKQCEREIGEDDKETLSETD